MALAVCYLTMVRSAAPSGPFEQYAETAPLIACLFIHSLLGDDGARQGNWRVVACPFPMGGDQPCRVYHIGTRLRLPVPDFVSAAPRQHDKCCMEVVSVAAVGAQHMRYIQIWFWWARPSRSSQLSDFTFEHRSQRRVLRQVVRGVP